MVISDDGAIDEGQFSTNYGEEYDLVGQARSINDDDDTTSTAVATTRSGNGIGGNSESPDEATGTLRVCLLGGSVCYDAGACGCPDDYEPCHEVCTKSCHSGQYLDQGSCQCFAETSCGMGETLCNEQCVSITCNYNQLFDDASCQCVNRCSSEMDYCNDVYIDVVNTR